MSAADTAKWGTWKTHGNATHLIYFGQNRKQIADHGIELVKVGMEKSMLHGRTADDKIALWGGPATRFWAAQPDVTPVGNNVVVVRPDHVGEFVRTLVEGVTQPEPITEEDRDSDGQALESGPIVNVVKPQGSKNKGERTGQSGSTCRCGCQQIARLGRDYLQGHDAKHTAKLFRAIMAGKLTLAEAFEVLPSDVLKAKLTAQVARHSK